MATIDVDPAHLEIGIAGRLVTAAGSLGRARSGLAGAQYGADGSPEPVASAYATMHAALAELVGVAEHATRAAARSVSEAGVSYGTADNGAMGPGLGAGPG